MEGKNVIGILAVVIMGVVVFGIVSLINGTLDNLDDKCETCGDDCEIDACANDSSSTGRMFSYVLIGIYLVSALGILYFSFKKEDEETKIEDQYAQEKAAPSNSESSPEQGEVDEYAYG